MLDCCVCSTAFWPFRGDFGYFTFSPAFTLAKEQLRLPPVDEEGPLFHPGSIHR
jgi:hypothetical protein